MDSNNTTLIQTILEDHLGRPPTPGEIVNMQNDALLLARFLVIYAQSLEARIAILEGNSKVVAPILTPAKVISQLQ